MLEREIIVMELTEVATRVISTSPDASVFEVAERMGTERIGAMVVLDGGKLVGLISERDIVARVVAKRRAPGDTRVAEIMTTKVQTISEGSSCDDALEMMHRGRFRHLPLTDRGGKVIGMISIRHLIWERMDELALKNADLVAFISTDGPGG
jgi:CBS domain-containing protein